MNKFLFILIIFIFFSLFFIKATKAEQPIIIWEDPTPDNDTTIFNNWIYLNTTITSPAGRNTSAFIDWNRSLVGYWAMDWYNSSGIFDNSSYNNFGSFKGGLSVDNITSGKFGKALEFDGSNDYIAVPPDGSLNITDELTIEAWIKPNTLNPSSDMIIVRKAPNDNYDFFIGGGGDAAKGNLGFVYYTSPKLPGFPWEIIDSGYKLPDTNWHHVAVVFDFNADSVKFYDNGVLRATNSTEGYNLEPNVEDLTIGSENGDIKFFNGTIDEIRIYNRALSPEEINASYNNSLYRLYHNFTSLSYGTYNYYAYAIDTEGYANKTGIRYLTIDIPPRWQNQNSNTTTIKAGDPVLLYTYWTDNINLSYAILSTNETGSWQNKTTYTLSLPGNESWSNFTWQNTSIKTAKVIGWKIHANDTSNNWNVTDEKTFTIDTRIFITIESGRMTSKREIIARPNMNVQINGTTFYAADNSAYGNKQLAFTYDTRSLGSNTTNSSGHYLFTFSIPYEGSYNLTVTVNDTYNNTGENTTVLYISTHPLSVKYAFNFTLGTAKENDLYKKGSKYVCGYDNTEYSDGLVLSLIHSYKTLNLEDIGFESASSQGLVGYWKFDDGSGTAAMDSSDNGNDGTLYNGSIICSGGDCPSWVDGKFGEALSFDGIDDYVDVGDKSTLDFGAGQSFTVEAWIKTSSSIQRVFLVKRATTGNLEGYRMLITYGISGKATFHIIDVNGYDTYAESTTTVTDGKWHHIVGVRDVANDKLYIYVDGFLEASVSDTTTGTLENSASFKFGTDRDNTTFFNGIIDNIRIYNRALSEGEIKTNYESKSKLKQKIENSQLLLTYTKGTCQTVENRMYLVESYAIPSRAFSSFSYPIPTAVPILIQFKNDRIQINGTDRFSAGSHKICTEKSGISLGNKPIIKVGKC